MRFFRTGTMMMRAAAALALGLASAAFAKANPDKLVGVPRGHMVGPGRRTVSSRSLRHRSKYNPHIGKKQRRQFSSSAQFPEHVAWLARREARP